MLLEPIKAAVKTEVGVSSNVNPTRESRDEAAAADEQVIPAEGGPWSESNASVKAEALVFLPSKSKAAGGESFVTSTQQQSNPQNA